MLLKGLNVTKGDINQFSKKEGYLSHLKYIGDSLHYCTKNEVIEPLNRSEAWAEFKSRYYTRLQEKDDRRVWGAKKKGQLECFNFFFNIDEVKVKYKAFLQPVQEDPTAPNVEINTSDFLSESDGSNEEVKPIDAVLAGKFNGIGGNADITLQKELKAEESTDMAPVKQKDDGEG